MSESHVCRLETIGTYRQGDKYVFVSEVPNN